MFVFCDEGSSVVIAKTIFDGQIVLELSDFPKVHDLCIFNELSNNEEHPVVDFVTQLLQ